MIKSSSFGFLPDGKEARLYHLKNGKFSADVSDFGATLVRFIGPDKNGNPTDVVLGFDNVEVYAGAAAYMGATVGRFANRIEGGKFALNGKEYTLAVNNATNHLHGGIEGFNHKLFSAKDIDATTIEFGYISPDGEEGYPGNLDVQITYSLKNDGTLTIDYYAISDADTVINLTNHTYFNLNGARNPVTVLDHTLCLSASAFCEADETGLANGNILATRNTAFDFKTEKALACAVHSDYTPNILAKGLDHNFIIDGNGYRKFATLFSEASGIEMVCFTDQPGVQIFTSNGLGSKSVITGKYGVTYKPYDAVCLETQGFPNATSFGHFPSPVLKKGRIYRRSTSFKLGVRK